jgi:hypothetical protein
MLIERQAFNDSYEDNGSRLHGTNAPADRPIASSSAKR